MQITVSVVKLKMGRNIPFLDLIIDLLISYLKKRIITLFGQPQVSARHLIQTLEKTVINALRIIRSQHAIALSQKAEWRLVQLSGVLDGTKFAPLPRPQDVSAAAAGPMVKMPLPSGKGDVSWSAELDKLNFHNSGASGALLLGLEDELVGELIRCPHMASIFL